MPPVLHQILRPPQSRLGGGELRLRLGDGGLGAGDAAARRAEVKIIQHGEPLAGLHVLADHGVDASIRPRAGGAMRARRSSS